MSEKPANEDQLNEAPEKIRKFRKGDLVRVDKAKYLNSLESKSSDLNLPDYIFEGPGELLLIKGDYCQVRWRRPVPDVWMRVDQLIEWQCVL